MDTYIKNREEMVIWLKKGDHFIGYDGKEYEVVSDNERWREHENEFIRSINMLSVRAFEVRPAESIFEMMEGIPDYLFTATKHWIKEVL